MRLDDQLDPARLGPLACRAGGPAARHPAARRPSLAACPTRHHPGLLRGRAARAHAGPVERHRPLCPQPHSARPAATPRAVQPGHQTRAGAHRRARHRRRGRPPGIRRRALRRPRRAARRRRIPLRPSPLASGCPAPCSAVCSAVPCSRSPVGSTTCAMPRSRTRSTFFPPGQRPRPLRPAWRCGARRHRAPAAHPVAPGRRSTGCPEYTNGRGTVRIMAATRGAWSRTETAEWRRRRSRSQSFSSN